MRQKQQTVHLPSLHEVHSSLSDENLLNSRTSSDANYLRSAMRPANSARGCLHAAGSGNSTSLQYLYSAIFGSERPPHRQGRSVNHSYIPTRWPQQTSKASYRAHSTAENAA
eukprot:6202873-Pleurochrysis_carterae.AAC.2